MTLFGLIFLGIIAICIFAYMFREAYMESDIGDSIFFALFITIVGLVVVFFITVGLSYINIKHEKDTVFGVTYVNSLSVKSNINGNFTLGTGHINEKEYYYYLSSTEFGYKICKLENNGDTYIKEDGGQKPYIEFTKYKVVEMNWFGKLFFKNSFFREEGERVFHVPTNTVVKQYNVDLNNL